MTNEAGMCMKTNKRPTIFTAKKAKPLRRRNDILYKCIRLLENSTGFLSLWERWGTNPALRDAETRCGGFLPPLRRQDGEATFRFAEHTDLSKVVEPTAPQKPDCEPGSQGRAVEPPLNAKMFMKQKGITVRGENPQKYIIMKLKELIAGRVARLAWKKHMENEGITREYSENKGDIKQLGQKSLLPQDV
jgi:hypothetical protein